MSTLKMLPAIRMDPRERKILNDNAKETVPYEGAEENVDITGFHLIHDTWDDLRFGVESTKLGSNAKPDYDFAENGLLFPRNDTGEVIYLVAQFPHAMKYGTALKPHIHFIQNASQTPVFKMKYRWYRPFQAVPAWTTITTTGVAQAYASGSIHQILVFPAISDSSINSSSSIMDIQIWRDDNVYVGDCLVKEFDIHFRSDTLGSLAEYVK
jgi:hypothetical protein